LVEVRHYFWKSYRATLLAYVVGKMQWSRDADFQGIDAVGKPLFNKISREKYFLDWSIEK